MRIAARVITNIAIRMNPSMLEATSLWISELSGAAIVR